MQIENKRLHTALIGCYAAHKRSCFQEFQKLNLTSGQPKVLSILFQNEGYLQKELADRCHVEPATITSILGNMMKKGFIRKEMVYVSGNKRAFAIYLTDLGRDMAIKVNKITDDMEELSFRDFKDDDKKLLLELLNRIQSNLDHVGR